MFDIKLFFSFQQDERYGERMAAASELLLMNCDFSSTTKHVMSFCRSLFNANLRSIFVWKKEDISNRREDMNYAIVHSLPTEVRTWIGQERAWHIRFFAVEVATCEPREKAVKYNGPEWMSRFRKMFTSSSGELHAKTIKVIKVI